MREPAKCGTTAGAQRHRRLGEPLCQACIDAERAYNRGRRPRPQCGTDGGYFSHRIRHETVCEPCLNAHAASYRAEDNAPPPPFTTFRPDTVSRLLDQVDGDWLQLAACAGTDDPDVFFPHPAGPAGRAIAICARCPVRSECIDAGLALPVQQDQGVRGGLTEPQRANLRRRRARRQGAH